MKLAPRWPIRGTKVVSRVDEVLRVCEDKKILHLGCADMPYTSQRGDELLHKKLLKVTEQENLWGLDASEEGINTLRELGYQNLICGNVEDAHTKLKQEKFDIILAGEIIEHLDNPGLFLESVRSIMTDNSEFILTTVNAPSFKGFLFSMLRLEKVHPDHNYYFSYRTLKQLLEKFDLTCDEIYYYVEIQGKGFARFLDKILSYATLISPVWGDGIIVRAKYNKLKNQS